MSDGREEELLPEETAGTEESSAPETGGAAPDYADPKAVTGVSKARRVNKSLFFRVFFIGLIVVFIVFAVQSRMRKGARGKEKAEGAARGVNGLEIVRGMRERAGTGRSGGGAETSVPGTLSSFENGGAGNARVPPGAEIAEVFTDSRGKKWIVNGNGEILSEEEMTKEQEGVSFYDPSPSVVKDDVPRYDDKGGGKEPPPPEHSKLVPEIEGSLGNAGKITEQAAAAAEPRRMSYEEYLAQSAEASRQMMAGMPQPAAAPVTQSDYDAQNAQSNKQSFYSGRPDGSSTVINGQYIIENTIWTGTIIPGVLETAVSTDLPGEVLARVSRNVYDSKTGKHLLIPQGSMLVARYNSSVSYAQSRVQIVWDTLIRPDGYQVQFGGMNGVDEEGMSGQGGKYHENWFQYLKAAGIITLFTIANSKMTQAVAEIGAGDATGAAAEANANMMAQLGGNIITRALNIQPTITVDSGTPVNIMLNKNIYLPPVEDYPVKNKYRRE